MCVHFTRSRSGCRGYPGLLLYLIISVTVGTAAAAQADSSTPVPAPNRTVPKVAPPRTTLEFSAQPTTQEIFRARVFAEPLVPVAGEPGAEENLALAAALLGYAKRSGPDDFSSLTGYLDTHPHSPWNAALLTDLGLEYYNTAHYSLALDSWEKAWALAKDGATTAEAKALADRALGELAYMYARLGRMDQLDALMKSIKGRRLVGPATEKIAGAAEGLWNMHNRPEIAFRCGPLALERVKRSVDPEHPATDVIFKSASTQKGFSLSQVADLSKKIGLNYQMAFRQPGAAFVVPSVVHWKVGHYAALVRQVGDLYLLQDPTFRNDVWATREALEAETSGYFLIPSGALAKGWRTVAAAEGANIWGKGQVGDNDAGPCTKRDPKTGSSCGLGMMTSGVHLMDVNLNLVDKPLGYTPPVGPPVELAIRYSNRDLFQPANFSYVNLGAKWTCDWIAYIVDNPSNSLADVNFYADGGGNRTFTGFDTNTQTFAYQQYDQTLLTRTATNPISYQMTWPDGSRMIFNQSDGSVGTTRKIFLTQELDPQGNALTFTYDSELRLVAVTDAIGQVTTLEYDPLPPLPFYIDHTNKITKVTDPFGRSATFNYVPVLAEEVAGGCPDNCYIDKFYTWTLGSITDVAGMTSQVTYADAGDVTYFFQTNNLTQMLYGNFVNSMITPYGTNHFTHGTINTTRFLETTYPDGSRDRVEFNQATSTPGADPPASVPQGMSTYDSFLGFRDTFYWSRNAGAQAYGDYSKARIFHWLHTADGASASGIPESTKEPLENRVWYDYAGQPTSYFVGTSSRPQHVGRVLDDGSTQLYTYGYNGFGHPTNMVDPAGRAFYYVYATNGIDLVKVQAGNNDVLYQATYNSQHRPLTIVDAAGQTNSYTWNARGQLLTATNPRNETDTYTYDSNGYLIALHGRLPGTNNMSTATYDAYGRTRTLTDASGYALTFDYDNLNRITRITYPDSTFTQYTYDLMNLASIRDRAGRVTIFEHDNMRHIDKITDPLGRVTLLDWCQCGDLKSLIDPLGRITSWVTDVQGRPIAKRYADGSQINYIYEKTTSRVRQIIDEKLQTATFFYNPDDTLGSISYDNAAIPTPGVSYTYDPNYRRVTSMTDGAGTTLYSYNPITGLALPGAGQLASVAGPLTNETITFGYDELGRLIHKAINGVDSALMYDAGGRLVGASNSLGGFAYTYQGNSGRLASLSFPNGQTAALGYGGNLQDFNLQQIAFTAGATPISTFGYAHDVPAGRLASWSQQAGAQPASLFSFAYDDANQLVSATVTNSGTQIAAYAYSYDPAGNRLMEQSPAGNFTATYNALNQLSVSTDPAGSRTNEWDAANRLTAVNSGNQRAELSYDGQSRVAGIRQLVSGVEVSHRLFVWNGGRISEERDTNGVVTKRFFPQGVQFTTGTNAGVYYYTRDHLGSVRELTDAGGNVRARYAYDPYGRRTKVSGDVDADFGFAGMFWSAEASLWLTHFRAYDPDLGRWLSRDPLKNEEVIQRSSPYTYVANNPVNLTDALGLEPGLGLGGGGLFDLGPETKPEDDEETDEWEETHEWVERLEWLMRWQEFNTELLNYRIERWAEPALEEPEYNMPKYEFPERGYPGFSGVFTEIVREGFTILTMTDCNTVNGIFALARVQRGELANAYENMEMKELKREGGF